ncbi:MAG: T9SS type A sorting domain-containing protein, partial [Flavobacteriales bacterium]
PDFTLGTGSLTNGDGNFVIDTLHRGQYAFANGDIFAGLAELEPQADIHLNVFPNPASDVLDVSGKWNGNEVALFDVYSTEGRFLQRTAARIEGAFSKRIDTSGLGAGSYLVQVRLSDGSLLGRKQFIVAR